MSIVAAAIALITQILPYLGAGAQFAGTAGKIVSLLEAIVPPLLQEAKDMVPTVKNIIRVLRGSSQITKADLDALDAIEATVDQAFDAAASAALAEDAAAEPSKA